MDDSAAFCYLPGEQRLSGVVKLKGNTNLLVKSVIFVKSAFKIQFTDQKYEEAEKELYCITFPALVGWLLVGNC